MTDVLQKLCFIFTHLTGLGGLVGLVGATGGFGLLNLVVFLVVNRSKGLSVGRVQDGVCGRSNVLMTVESAISAGDMVLWTTGLVSVVAFLL